MNCLICGSPKAKDIFLEDEIFVQRCLNCRHVYSSYSGQDNFAGYFSDDVSTENHFWWREAHNNIFQTFRKFFLYGGSGRLLDFGCGLGYFLASIKLDQNCSQWTAQGVEISAPACDYAKTKLGLLDIHCGTLSGAVYQKNYFNIVTMWDVIEHLPDPRPTLKEIRELLDSGGIIFLATPNINVQLPKARLKKILKRGRGGHYLEARDHLHNYSPTTMRRLLGECGFKNITFLQLPPIDSVSGSRNKYLRFVKKLWHQLAKTIFFLSFGRLNFNNLYVVAYK